MKMIIKILGVLVLVVAVLVGLSLYYLDSGVKKAIETFGPQYTKTRVELMDVSLSPLSGKGSLTGLTIGNPQGFSDANAFSLGEVAIVIDTQTLSADPVVIHSIRIIAPQIIFEQGKKSTNLQQLLKNIEQPGEAVSSKKDEPVKAEGDAKKIIIKDLQISGGQLHYMNPLLGGKTIDLALPDIQLRGIGEKSGGASGAEITEQIIAAVSKSANQAIADGGGIKAMGKQLEQGLKSEKDKLEKSLQGVKGLFDK
ncbi:MAG: hypothetical protein KBT88_01690 [Gammaproteobacteria bacterium]|nr:hypothetical protein [Gammaproteobacteria bacterium]MBQ0838469.1 hypothetical protein [Gammaproteobacteria bacterium]